MNAAPAVAENIIAFARALRAAGLKLGPRSAVDAVEAVETAGFSTREDFYWTLHAVLVKRHEDDPVFDSAFRLFWRQRDPNETILAEMLPLAPTAPIEKAGARRVQEMERHARIIAHRAGYIEEGDQRRPTAARGAALQVDQIAAGAETRAQGAAEVDAAAARVGFEPARGHFLARKRE